MTTETTAQYKYLLPLPDAETQPWWDGIKRHELLLQRCVDCQTFRHPPQGTCTRCYSEQAEWVKTSGRGTVYTFILVYHPVLRQWQDDIPYNIVQVTPEEAPDLQIYGNMVGVENAEIRVGMPVQVVFDDVTPQHTIPRWQPR